MILWAAINGKAINGKAINGNAVNGNAVTGDDTVRGARGLPGPEIQGRQLSLRLKLPVDGTVTVRFAPDSHVTFEPSITMYL